MYFIAVFTCISFVSNDAKPFFMCLFVNLYTFTGEVFVKFRPFLHWFIWFVIIESSVLLIYILDIYIYLGYIFWIYIYIVYIPYIWMYMVYLYISGKIPDISPANILSQFVTYLFIVSGVLFVEHNFYFDEV